MREIVLDTETTGLDPKDGHRVIEIGCVELINHLPTDNQFHVYINPARDVPADAVRIHGLTNEFLTDKPAFGAVVDDFLEFIAEDTLIIHNAEFDMRFLNHEMSLLRKPPLVANPVIDTLGIARRKFPGSPANLDALCRRFNIDNSNRQLHGALLDSELLAEVYLELIGGKQRGFGFQGDTATEANDEGYSLDSMVRIKREPRPHEVSEQEKAAHATFLQKLKEPFWLKDN
jgi:DNA polymerase-3 subunit epsilon